MQNLVSVMKYCMVFWMVLMILLWGKQERERSTQFQKYSRRSVWGVSLSKMLLHFWLNLRPWFLGNGLLVKVCDTLKIYYMVSVYSQKWTENIWSLYQSFRSDLPTLGDKRIPTLTLYILETRRKSWVSDVLKRVQKGIMTSYGSVTKVINDIRRTRNFIAVFLLREPFLTDMMRL